MRVLFVHQNMPGQFGHLARALARDPKNEVAFVTRRKESQIEGVERVSYDLRLPPSKGLHGAAKPFAAQVYFGEAVVRACQAMKLRGYEPDVIVGHPGWGELLFMKDLFPETPLISYAEFYYNPRAPYVQGDPPRGLSLDEKIARHGHSAHLLLSLEAADRGWSPTAWQRSLHPPALQSKIEVIFDGVDTHTIRPDPGARFELPDGRALSPADEVITYAARGLEPCRGFPSFVRALPDLLARRPSTQIVMQSPKAAQLQRVLAAVRKAKALARSEKIAVDVDPTSLL